MAKSGLSKKRNVRLGFALLRATEPNLPAVNPETVRDLLAKEIAAPLRGGNADLSPKSLFGDSHRQLEFFK